MSANAPLLKVEALRLSAGAAEILHGIDFSLQRGKLAALVGESGSGKTMAARAILKLLPDGVRIVGGKITLDGTEVTSASEKTMRSLRGPIAGMVFQEPMVSLNPAMTVGSQMAEAMRYHTALSREEIRGRAIAMLKRVRISDPEACLTAYPHQFSGGMRQRIMLASVMLLKPKLLVADEPTTALDTLSQREVLDLMVELAEDAGTAVLLITHNLGLVSRYTSDMIVLRRGTVVEAGATEALIGSATHPYTRELIAAARSSDAPPPPPPAQHSPEVLRAEGISIAYAGRTENTVTDVDLAIRKGETVALVGGSGSGKTTVGKAMLGFVPLAKGQLRFRGEAFKFDHGLSGRDARLSCQMVFQDPYSSLDPRHRIGAIIGEPLRHDASMNRDEKHARVVDVLQEVGLSGLEKRYPHELSGGQRQRVAIARAIVRRPALVIADEPVSALDMTIQSQILDLILSLQRRHGFACLFISHDLSAVRKIAHRVVVMEAGRIVEQGDAATILDRPTHPYTAQMVEAAPFIERTTGANSRQNDLATQ